MRIAIVYPDDFSIWHFHRELVTELVNRGHEVWAMSKKGKYLKQLISLGIRHIPLSYNRFINPMMDLKLLHELYLAFKKYRFDIVHNFTIKANIYGSIAAKMAGIKRIIGTVEGLGFLYAEEPDNKLWLMRPLIDTMYKTGCLACDRLWFINPDDMKIFIDRGILPQEKAYLTISIGVNTDRYSVEKVKKKDLSNLRNELGICGSDQVVMLLVARVVWSKGIREFVEAAEALEKSHRHLKFLLIGPTEEDSPDAVPLSFLVEKQGLQNFFWLGFRRDIRELYSLSDIVVLPSYYREGVPMVLLEAMAMGKPIITTDNVGCREVIRNGENGYMIPIKDSAALAEAISTLVNDETKLITFGRASRILAEKKFNKKLIVDKIIEKLYELH